MKHILTLLTTAFLLFGQATQANVQDEPVFSDAELDSILAPIALYPDTVLSHILIAATYPLEVVEAERWARQQDGLSSEEILLAAELHDWDPSVQALTPFPQLLSRMSDDLQWTQQLGDAFLQSESRVLDSIQKLRQRAYDEGNLKSNDYQDVEYSNGEIVIEPTRTQVVYVPYYDTRVVYGSWWWPTYPPCYWAYRPIHGYPSFHIGFAWWTPGFYLGSGVYFGGFHWHQRQVVVVHHSQPRHYSRHHVAHYQNTRRWVHNPSHRRGVHYRTPQVAERYHSNRAPNPRMSVYERNTGRTYGTQRREASRDEHERLVRNMRDPKGYRDGRNGDQNGHGPRNNDTNRANGGDRGNHTARDNENGHRGGNSGGGNRTADAGHRNSGHSGGSDNNRGSETRNPRVGGEHGQRGNDVSQRGGASENRGNTTNRNSNSTQARISNELKARSQTEQWRSQSASPKYQHQQQNTNNARSYRSDPGVQPGNDRNNHNNWQQRNTQNHSSSGNQREYASSSNANSSNRSYSNHNQNNASSSARYSGGSQQRSSGSASRQQHSGGSRASGGGRGEYRSR